MEMLPKQSDLPNNINWQTEAGKMFQVNKLNFQALEESTAFFKGISSWNSFQNVEINGQSKDSTRHK